MRTRAHGHSVPNLILLSLFLSLCACVPLSLSSPSRLSLHSFTPQTGTPLGRRLRNIPARTCVRLRRERRRAPPTLNAHPLFSAHFCPPPTSERGGLPPFAAARAAYTYIPTRSARLPTRPQRAMHARSGATIHRKKSRGTWVPRTRSGGGAGAGRPLFVVRVVCSHVPTWGFIVYVGCLAVATGQAVAGAEVYAVHK